MCAASVCVLQVCVLLVCVCDRTIESWATQIVARLSGYAACPCVWITCFSYMPHCCWSRGDRVRWRGVGVCVACVKLHLSDFLACSTQTQNYICRWEMPHNQVTTTECRMDRHGRLQEQRQKGQKGATGAVYAELDRQNWQLTDAIGASWRSDMWSYLPLPPFVWS